MGRLAKQLFIGAIYLAIFGTLGYGIYDWATPDATCSDGRQNQGEEGVDCGTVCGVLCGAPLEPLLIGEPELFPAGNAVDVMVEFDNTNIIYGAERIDWQLVLSDVGGGVVASRRGFTYANPLETRFLVVTVPGVIATDVADVAFVADTAHIRWFVGQFDESQVVDFSVMNESLVVNEDGTAQYRADIRNDSTFDFDEVDVSVVLRDGSGVPVAVGATIIRTVPAREIRIVTLEWPFDIGAVPTRAQAEVSTNVFDNDNFIRTYGAQERFQGF